MINRVVFLNISESYGKNNRTPARLSVQAHVLALHRSKMGREAVKHELQRIAMPCRWLGSLRDRKLKLPVENVQRLRIMQCNHGTVPVRSTGNTL